MGELAAKARMELEELYLGIPDDSVNLTFQDLPDLKQKANASEKKKSTSSSLSVETIQEAKNPKQQAHQVPPLIRLPSLDFNRGQQATKDHTPYHQRHANYLDQLDYEDSDFDSHTDVDKDKGMGHHNHHHRHHDIETMHARDFHRYGAGGQSHRNHATSPRGRSEFRHGLERSVAFDDVSVVSMASTIAERGQRRRPGIPHSNICAICCTYIYIFRHRCLVCGRVYCKQCVHMGMGEMTEGRKCILCLGRRFSQRYIKRAGKMGCCSRNPSNVKQAELKWAEKGPRRSGERVYGQSSMLPRSRSPVNPRTPSRTHATNTNINAPSFVASSPAYSPYTPSHHHLPL